MIPVQFRLYAAAVALLLIMAASGAAGFKIGDWRANSAHAAVIQAHAEQEARLNKEIGDLQHSLAAQNSAVAVLQARSLAARDAQMQAEQHAADLAKISASRLAKLTKLSQQSTTAGEVLQQYWGISN